MPNGMRTFTLPHPRASRARRAYIVLVTLPEPYDRVERFLIHATHNDKAESEARRRLKLRGVGGMTLEWWTRVRFSITLRTPALERSQKISSWWTVSAAKDIDSI